jgi:hypothetical protein
MYKLPQIDKQEMKLLIQLILFVVGIFIIIISFLGNIIRVHNQPFGIVSDDYFWYVFLIILVLNIWSVSRHQETTFFKTIQHHFVQILIFFTVHLFTMMSIIDLINWNFPKAQLTSKCKIVETKFIKSPISPSEGDYHYYPYYELTVKIDDNNETFDCSPKNIRIFENKNSDTIILTYNVGLLGTKYLLTPIYVLE